MAGGLLGLSLYQRSDPHYLYRIDGRSVGQPYASLAGVGLFHFPRKSVGADLSALFSAVVFSLLSPLWSDKLSAQNVSAQDIDSKGTTCHNEIKGVIL